MLWIVDGRVVERARLPPHSAPHVALPHGRHRIEVRQGPGETREDKW